MSSSRPGIRRIELDRLLCRPEIQQAVAQGQVEQFALPAVEAIFRLARLRSLGLRDIVVRQVGSVFENGFQLRRRGSGLDRHRRLGARQGPDALQTGAPDVDGEFEGMLDRLGNLLRADFHHPAEWRTGAVRHRRRFEQDQLVELHPLAKRGDVVDDRAAEFLRLQPDAGEGMAVREDDERIQAALFQYRAEQQGGIQAGGDAGIGNLAGAPDFLAGVLEARGRQSIVETHCANRGPDCRSQFPCPLRATLVAVQRAALAMLAEDFRGFLEQPLRGRVVGLDEGGRHFGHMADAAPLVAGQQFDRRVKASEFLPLGRSAPGLPVRSRPRSSRPKRAPSRTTSISERR